MSSVKKLVPVVLPACYAAVEGEFSSFIILAANTSEPLMKVKL
jgi:hypothetical protein